MTYRKKKLLLIQLLIFFSAITLLYITYYNDNSNNNSNANLILSKKNNQSENSNTFENIEYKGVDLNGNRYIIRSEIADFDSTTLEIINMKIAKTTFYFKDGTTLVITGDYGTYNNKTYDMKNKQFGQRNKYDYITTTTGYDYEEPAIDYKNEISGLMGDIFSNKEVEKCSFSVCRSGLTGVWEEKFTIVNGRGDNGKGLINYVMGLLWGNYFHDVSHSVITKEITDDKPLPAISKLNGVRYCVISEIKEDSILLEDSIKKLTNPIINARGMYSSITRVINTATYVAECNARPKIQGENGDAMSRRYIDVFFNKRYTSDPDKLKLDGYLPANPIFKTNDYWIPRRVAFFFWLLDYNDTIYEPPIVKARSKEFLKECNIPLVVFEDKIEKCEFDKTKDTLITAGQFLDIIRHSEEFKYLEKQEKKLYTKNKVIDFFKNTFFDDYKKKQNVVLPTWDQVYILHKISLHLLIRSSLTM